MMQTKTAFALLAILASAAAVGCGTSTSTPPPAGVQRASLHRSKSCGDLLGDLKADAAYKLNKAISRQIEGIQACVKRYGEDRCAYYGGYYGGGGGDFGVGRGEATSDAKGGAAPPAAPNQAGSSSSSSGGGSAESYSETNTQVKGVDEADIIKNDGKQLYVLHGRSFRVLNAWPANDLREVGSIDVEGQPSEMFVADGKVVIYSQVNGTKIFQAAGVTPKTSYTDYGYGYPGGGGGGAAREDIAPSYPGGGGGGTGEAYAPLTKVTVMTLTNGTTPVVTREVYFEGNYLDARRVGSQVRTVLQGMAYGPKLKYSVYELYPQSTTNGGGASPKRDPGDDTKPTPPDQPVEPQPTQPDPTPKTGSQMIAALEQLRASNLAAINASQLGEWLPFTFVKEGAGVSAKTVACEDFYVPTVGSTQSGITEVAALDLADPSATPKESAILGRAETVYGNADTLYLAAQAWVEPPFMWNDLDEATSGSGGSGGGDVASPPPSTTPVEPAPAPAPKPGGKELIIKTGGLRTQADPAKPNLPVVGFSSANTHIHKFDFKAAPNFPNYVASGTVVGTVKNQFSLDDRNGALRIATTENRQYVTVEGKWVSSDSSPPESGRPVPARPNTVNHVFVLGQQGPWLEQDGDVGELAPNEQIYSVRFVGGRGYVVTFRQIDPLFVIDLQNPKAPTLLAALKIPGFSEYMHPLDENHLLTIGRDASASGRTQALQLQIFDVTDGAHPKVQQKFTYKGDYGQSEAEYDHKAFTFFDDKGLLAFPYYSYNNVDGGQRSSLELFKVDANTGFSKIGSIDSTSLVKQNPSGYCGGYYAPSVRRGVFLENFVYSVSYGGVVVRDSNNLVAPGAELALPTPTTNDGYGPPCAGGL